MTTIIYKKRYSSPVIDRREALRYAGAREGDERLCKLLDECISEASPRFTYKLCYGEFPIIRLDSGLSFGFASVCSEKLSRHLSGCESAIIFAATVGLEVDRLIARYGRTSPTKALMLQGLGAERIEALCDLFFAEQSAEKTQHGAVLTPRFSAGYGDLSLEFQRDIFKALDCPKNIGLTLNESLIMSPTKSVTAIIGIKKDKL